jgi:eukaryotic-like serine/threonine-protein kinase
VEEIFWASLVGASLAGQKRYEEAEPFLISGYQGMVQRQTGIPPESRQVVSQTEKRIVQLYEAWGKPEKAAGWRAKIQPK